MKIDVIMPKMGESITEGTIISWRKKVGDKIKKDEIIFEISTDKVDTEIPSPEEGTLTEIIFNESETVEVGTVVARIDTIAQGEPVNSDKVKTKNSKEKVQNIKPVGMNNSIPAQIENYDLVDIIMPKMGESVMEGTIIKWYKKVGDAIKKEETIFEISTDKVDTEVPASEEGFLFEILTFEQETVPVNTVVARISKVKSPNLDTSTKSKGIEENNSIHSVIASNSVRENQEIAKLASEVTKKFYSPLVLSIAQSEGVSFEELDSLKGTGIEGRVTKKDILEYVSVRANKIVPSKVTEIEKPAPIPVAENKNVQPLKEFVSISSGSVEKIPMDNIRQKIMQHMVRSRDTSVHVTAVVEVDMSQIASYMQKNKDSFQTAFGVKLTYMSFIARASVKAIGDFPLINSALDGNTIIKKHFINLGIAVAMEPNGLIVPNIKNAQDINLGGMARAITEIAVKSRTKKLTPDDISGGTFTITNYGVFGTLIGTPIINQPEVAILGIGTVVKRPVVIENGDFDSIGIKPMMYLTLSHDHRLVDGMLGGKFLKSIKDYLENFDEKGMF